MLKNKVLSGSFGRKPIGIGRSWERQLGRKDAESQRGKH